MPNSISINLSKNIYGAKGTLRELNEEFKEFAPNIKNTKEFFNAYSQNFYNIPQETHDFFIDNSINYISNYINPKQREINTLSEQLDSKQTQIDSLENRHPILKNNSVVVSDIYKDRATTAIDDIGRDDFYGVFLIYSGKKRKITKKSIYESLRIQLGIGKSDEEFLIFLPSSTIIGIRNGPPIETINQVWAPFTEVNTYGRQSAGTIDSVQITEERNPTSEERNPTR